MGNKAGMDQENVSNGESLGRSLPMLFTPEEAAEQLGIGRTKVYGLIGCGILRSVRIGASRRIRNQDLIDFVNELATAN